MNDTGEKTKHKDIGELIISRRTINFFHQKSVPVSLLTKAIDAARWAPNHKITEPWHFYILGTKTRVKVIQLITEIKSTGKGEKVHNSIKKRLEDVPGWFVLTSDLSRNSITRQENYAACCCAIQNVMLYLWNHGIGVKWTTGEVTRDKRFYKLLKIDKDMRKVVGLFWYGYPAFVPAQRRKPAKEITTRLD
jgi:nitroreductase